MVNLNQLSALKDLLDIVSDADKKKKAIAEILKEKDAFQAMRDDAFAATQAAGESVKESEVALVKAASETKKAYEATAKADALLAKAKEDSAASKTEAAKVRSELATKEAELKALSISLAKKDDSLTEALAVNAALKEDLDAMVKEYEAKLEALRRAVG